MNNFEEYLFYLLPGPLKRNLKQNQFRTFFQVIGRQLDDLKNRVLSVREESSLLTTSEGMLNLFATERDMYRYKGESVEEYRNRLLMKADIAELAGTEKGILLALESIGFRVTIIPAWKLDANRWAEIYIKFPVDIDVNSNIDFACIQREVRKVKQASTYPIYQFLYPATVNTTEMVGRHGLQLYMTISSYNIRSLDGRWLLDGSALLNAEANNFKAISRHRTIIENHEENLNGQLEVRNRLHYLDGNWVMDGSRTLDSYIKKEAL